MKHDKRRIYQWGTYQCQLLEAYKTTAENTFGRKMKRNGLIFQVAKELKRKYETAESEE